MNTLSPEAHQRKIVRALGLAQILNGVGVAGTVAAGSLLVSSITKSEGLSGLAQTTSVLGAAVMALPLARLTQSGGRRLALTFGYSVGGIGALLAIFGGANRNLFFMLLGVFMVGAASASGYQARFAAIDLATPENRSKNLSFVVWGSTIGAVTGPNLMEPSGIFASSLGLPKLVGPYFIAAFTLALSVTVIQLFLKPDPYLTANKAAEGSASKKRETFRTALSHVREFPIAIFAIASVAVGHLAMVSIMVMTPVHMAHFAATLRIIGLVISVHVLGMYAFSPIVGSISDKIGRIKTIQIGILILIASALISGLAPQHDSFTLGIGLFLLGLGWSFTLIAGSTLLSETVSLEMRPSTQGASDLVMNLMGAGGAAIGGVIIGFFSYAALCYATGLVVLALGIWSLRIKAN
ncbi:MAG: MFS transporter [Actinobacteria bacterium]|uniref:Unannotated protein n=1 Tax=freshwater metagenome TaxID=449393 RepID=A0A6J6RZM9_9ZZZZ|nr:MFS transporter [Actinomycetota bacterium]MSZ01936.1 MFS transporter [Actinomycetota bacterium]